MNELRIYVRHISAAGFCLLPGGRDWFKHHGLDWKDFIRNGIAVSQLEGIDDELSRRVIEQARAEQARNGA